MVRVVGTQCLRGAQARWLICWRSAEHGHGTGSSAESRTQGSRSGRHGRPDGLDAAGLMWIQGEGFPKSVNAGRAIDVHVCKLPGRHCATKLPAQPGPDDHVCPESPQGDPWRGHGTALKPAWEPIVVARKPRAGTVATSTCSTAQGHSTSTVAGFRPVQTTTSTPRTRILTAAWAMARQTSMATARAAITSPAQADGRRTCWPVLARRRAEIDRQSGVTSSRAGPSSALSKPRPRLRMTHTGAEYEDSGGASRFFPVFRYEAKAGQHRAPAARGRHYHGRPSSPWPSRRG